MTCQSFSSVSLDPPLVLFCPAKTSRAWPLIQRAGHFCVNFLAAGQAELSNQMASRGVDKFDGVALDAQRADRRAAPRRHPRLRRLHDPRRARGRRPLRRHRPGPRPRHRMTPSRQAAAVLPGQVRHRPTPDRPDAVPTHPLWRPFELTDLEQSDAAVVGLVAAGDRARRAVRRRPGRSARPRSCSGDPRRPRRPRPRARARRLDLGARARGQAGARPRRWSSPTRPTRRRTSPPWSRWASCCTSASRTGRSTGCSPAPDRSVNLHVFGAGSPRAAPARRCSGTGCAPTPTTATPYGALKTELAAQGFERVMDYNNHKAELVYDIYETDLRRRPGARARPAAAALTSGQAPSGRPVPAEPAPDPVGAEGLLVGGQGQARALEAPAAPRR